MRIRRRSLTGRGADALQPILRGALARVLTAANARGGWRLDNDDPERKVTGMDSEALSRLTVSLAIGLLVGLERGWQTRDAEDNRRAAGFRTFALSGLLGGVTGLIALQTSAAVIGWVFLGYVDGVRGLSLAGSQDRRPCQRDVSCRGNADVPARDHGCCRRSATCHCLCCRHDGSSGVARTVASLDQFVELAGNPRRADFARDVIPAVAATAEIGRSIRGKRSILIRYGFSPS